MSMARNLTQRRFEVLSVTPRREAFRSRRYRRLYEAAGNGEHGMYPLREEGR
jgi:hypothetical protein